MKVETTITLTIKETRFNLTLDEARSLTRELMKALNIREEAPNLGTINWNRLVPTEPYTRPNKPYIYNPGPTCTDVGTKQACVGGLSLDEGSVTGLAYGGIGAAGRD